MFVRDVGPLYGVRFYTYNIHTLLHLPLLVLRWGPLWATSTFITEGFNRVLGNLIHGTKNKGQELINNIKITLGVEVLRHCVKGELKNRPQLPQYEVLNKPLHNSQLSGAVLAAIAQHRIGNFTVHIRA